MPRAGHLLLLVVLVAGCSGAPAPAATSPASTAPVATTPPTATPTEETPAASPTPQGNASARPAEGSPFSGVWSHRHAEGEAVVRFDVPAGAAPADVAIAFLPTLGAMQCDAEASVVVASPLAVLLVAEAGEGSGCGTVAAKRNETMHAGTWTIWANGTGDITSMVTIGAANASASRPFSFEAEHDFAEAPETIPFDVTRALVADVELDLEPGLAPSCVAAPEAAIELVDPEGEVVLRHALEGLSSDCGAPLVSAELPLAPGKWGARFVGSGSARGVVRVVASG